MENEDIEVFKRKWICEYPSPRYIRLLRRLGIRCGVYPRSCHGGLRLDVGRKGGTEAVQEWPRVIRLIDRLFLLLRSRFL